MRWRLAVGAIALITVLLAWWGRRLDAPTLTPLEEAGAVIAAFFGQATAPHPMAGGDPVYVVLRRAGRQLSEAWGEGPSLAENLRSALLEARSRTQEEPDAVDFCLTHDYSVPPDLNYLQTGIWGLEVEQGGKLRRLAPLQSISHNLSFSHFVGPPGSLTAMRNCQAIQGHVQLKPWRLWPLFRGHRVPSADVDIPRLEAFLGGVAAHLKGEVKRQKGRLTYLYCPGREAEQKSARKMVLVRPALATWSLALWARQDPSAVDALNLNLEWILTFLRQKGQMAYLKSDREAPLGATAILALALWEHPRPSARQVALRQALERGLDSLWQPDGSFHTSFENDSQGANADFYPGEAMVEMATRYQHQPDPEQLRRLQLSFAFYREHHRRRRVPAFIPWQTIADCRLYRLTHRQEVADFVFEMNDYLVDKIQSRSAIPDMLGSFFTVDSPAPGVGIQRPHASSTAVYVDGLIDALELAEELHDWPRAARYRGAMMKGLAHLQGLQFVDEADTYYVPTEQRERVLGAIRTNPWDSTIRVDNGPHCLLGGVKILRYLRRATP